MSEAYAWPELERSASLQLAELRAEARRTGAQEGLADAQRQAAAEVEAQKGVLRDAAAALEQARLRFAETDRALLVRTVGSLARAVLGVELRTNEEVISTFVSNALGRLELHCSRAVLEVAQADVPFLPDLEGIDVHVDPDRSPGSFSLHNDEAGFDLDPMAALDSLLQDADGQSATDQEGGVGPDGLG